MRARKNEYVIWNFHHTEKRKKEWISDRIGALLKMIVKIFYGSFLLFPWSEASLSGCRSKSISRCVRSCSGFYFSIPPLSKLNLLARKPSPPNTVQFLRLTRRRHIIASFFLVLLHLVAQLWDAIHNLLLQSFTSKRQMQYKVIMG